MILWKLFIEFFKVSCFTFGGAYGAIPLIRDMVFGNGWIGEEELSYMIAISESTPGPIIVNMATYIGSHRAGFWGSLVATVGVVLPAYLVILLVLGILKNVIKNPWAQAVLRGLKPCVTGIILSTGLYMVIRNVFPQGQAPEYHALVITALLTVVIFLYPKLRKKPLPPIALICISAVLGAVIYNF